MKFLVALSVLGLALSLSTQLTMEKPGDDSALINEFAENFDMMIQDALGNVFFAAADRLQSDIALVKEAIEDEEEEAGDADETEEVEEDWSERLTSDVGDALLQGLADAGKLLSDEFKKSLEAFAEKGKERAAGQAFLRALKNK
jgi:hypothetical protein